MNRYAIPRSIWDECYGTYEHTLVPGPTEKGGRHVVYMMEARDWDYLLDMGIAYAEPNFGDAEPGPFREKLRRCLKWLQSAKSELCKNVCKCKHKDFWHGPDGCDVEEVNLLGETTLTCDCKNYESRTN